MDSLTYRHVHGWDKWWDVYRDTYRPELEDYPVVEKWWLPINSHPNQPTMWELETRWRHRQGLPIEPRVTGPRQKPRQNFFNDTAALFEEPVCQR